MSLDYIRKTYKVPAYEGVRVSMETRKGVIVGAEGPHVKVKFDDRRGHYPVHPIELTYHVEPVPEETTTVGELQKGDSGPAHTGLASGVPVNPAHSSGPQEHDPKCTFHVTLGGVPVTGCVPHCPVKESLRETKKED